MLKVLIILIILQFVEFIKFVFSEKMLYFYTDVSIVYYMTHPAEYLIILFYIYTLVCHDIHLQVQAFCI